MNQKTVLAGDTSDDPCSVDDAAPWHLLLQALYDANNGFLTAHDAYRDYSGDHPSDEGRALWSARGDAAVTALRAYHELAIAITELEAERDRLTRKIRGLQLTVGDMAEAFGGVPGSLMGEFFLSESEIADVMSPEPNP